MNCGAGAPRRIMPPVQFEMTDIVNADGHSWPCHSVAMTIEIGKVRGTTRRVGVDHVVFASPVSFPVGSAISFVISTATEIRFECSAVVTDDQESPGGGFETAARVESIRIVPIESAVFMARSESGSRNSRA